MNNHEALQIRDKRPQSKASLPSFHNSRRESQPYHPRSILEGVRLQKVCSQLFEVKRSINKRREKEKVHRKTDARKSRCLCVIGEVRVQGGAAQMLVVYHAPNEDDFCRFYRAQIFQDLALWYRWQSRCNSNCMLWPIEREKSEALMRCLLDASVTRKSREISYVKTVAENQWNCGFDG